MPTNLNLSNGSELGDPRISTTVLFFLGTQEVIIWNLPLELETAQFNSITPTQKTVASIKDALKACAEHHNTLVSCRINVPPGTYTESLSISAIHGGPTGGGESMTTLGVELLGDMRPYVGLTFMHGGISPPSIQGGQPEILPNAEWAAGMSGAYIDMTLTTTTMSIEYVDSEGAPLPATFGGRSIIRPDFTKMDYVVGDEIVVYYPAPIDSECGVGEDSYHTATITELSETTITFAPPLESVPGTLLEGTSLTVMPNVKLVGNPDVVPTANQQPTLQVKGTSVVVRGFHIKPPAIPTTENAGTPLFVVYVSQNGQLALPACVVDDRTHRSVEANVGVTSGGRLTSTDIEARYDDEIVTPPAGPGLVALKFFSTGPTTLTVMGGKSNLGAITLDDDGYANIVYYYAYGSRDPVNVLQNSVWESVQISVAPNSDSCIFTAGNGELETVRFACLRAHLTSIFQFHQSRVSITSPQVRMIVDSGGSPSAANFGCIFSVESSVTSIGNEYIYDLFGAERSTAVAHLPGVPAQCISKNSCAMNKTLTTAGVHLVGTALLEARDGIAFTGWTDTLFGDYQIGQSARAFVNSYNSPGLYGLASQQRQVVSPCTYSASGSHLSNCAISFFSIAATEAITLTTEAAADYIGVEHKIFSNSAQAHQIVLSEGTWAGTGGATVAVFSGAEGDGICFYASADGLFHVTCNTGVSFSSTVAPTPAP